MELAGYANASSPVTVAVLSSSYMGGYLPQALRWQQPAAVRRRSASKRVREARLPWLHRAATQGWGLSGEPWLFIG
jgi:hypothetical protein